MGFTDCLIKSDWEGSRLEFREGVDEGCPKLRNGIYWVGD
jgi:hypothetical protein